MFYYIQRIEIDQDGMFKYDYMGAAEFEFGSIPTAYREFSDGISQTYNTGIKAKDGRALLVIVPEGVDATETIENVKKMAREGDFESQENGNHRRVKERTELKNTIDGTNKDRYYKYNCWFSVNCVRKDVFIAFLGEKTDAKVRDRINEFLLIHKK